MSSKSNSNGKVFMIVVIVAMLAAVGLSVYLYFKHVDNNNNMDKTDNKTPMSRKINPYAPSPVPYAPSPSPSPGPTPFPTPSVACNYCSDCDCLKKNNCPNYQSACVGPCGQYEDDNGACSQDGVKAYNNALMQQLNYICRASSKQNQVEGCMEMCENGQFGLPMCQSCCQAVCMNINCPPVGGGGGGGEPGGGPSECGTICRLQPNSEYCQQCSGK